MTDIRAALRDYLARVKERPFRWGVHDCFTFTSDWVAELAGCPNPANRYKNRYQTPLGAMRHLRRLGGYSWDDIPGLLYPVMEIRPAFATAGDVVSVTDLRYGAGLGICDGATVTFIGDPGGLQTRHHRDIERAWRIKKLCPKSAQQLHLP